MSEISPLVLAFLLRAPAAAAREFTLMAVEDAAARLGEIDPAVAAPVLASMSAAHAAAIVRVLDVRTGAARIAGLDRRDAAALLRCMAPGAREELIDALPPRAAQGVRSALSFPVDAVGRCMTASILTLDGQHTVGDAIVLARRAEAPFTRSVFVVGSQQRYAGAIDLDRLLRCPDERLLADVADAQRPSVSARDTLASLADSPLWDEHDVLPVVDRRMRLLGALERAVLARVLRTGSDAFEGPSTSLTAALVDAFGVSTVGLARLGLDAQSRPSGSSGGFDA